MKTFVSVLTALLVSVSCNQTSQTVEKKNESKTLTSSRIIPGSLVVIEIEKRKEGQKPTASIIAVIDGPGVTTHGNIGNKPIEFSFAHIETSGYLGPMLRFYRSDDRKDWVGAIKIQDPRNESEGSEEVVFVKRIKPRTLYPTVMVEKICCKKARITLIFPSQQKLLAWNNSIEAGFNSLKIPGSYPRGLVGNYQ